MLLSSKNEFKPHLRLRWLNGAAVSEALRRASCLELHQAAVSLGTREWVTGTGKFKETMEKHLD
jgi:hypothetical protein